MHRKGFVVLRPDHVHRAGAISRIAESGLQVESMCGATGKSAISSPNNIRCCLTMQKNSVDFWMKQTYRFIQSNLYARQTDKQYLLEVYSCPINLFLCMIATDVKAGNAWALKRKWERQRGRMRGEEGTLGWKWYVLRWEGEGGEGESETGMDLV